MKLINYVLLSTTFFALTACLGMGKKEEEAKADETVQKEQSSEQATPTSEEEKAA